jgi:diguanylate cyclase (GGDEF)-like protein
MNLPTDEKKAIKAERAAARSAYQANKLHAAQRNIHVLTSIASVVNFLFLVCDLMFIQGRTERIIIAIVRYAFSVLLIVMIRVLQRVRTYAVFTALITILEAASLVVFLFVLRLYETPDFMIQTLGILFSILLIFIVPNRKGNQLALSFAGTLAYFAMAFFCIPNIALSELVASIFYALLMITLCSVAIFGNDAYALKEFTARRRLEQTSSTDFLTNAATRARLEDEARRWMSFCRRQGLPLCLVFVDVDNLKRINDQYSHAAGDAVLKRIAELMQNQLRSSDTIARWGGDEFVLLLPNVSLQNAVLLLDRVKQAVTQIEVENVGSISCSFGVVEMGPESTYQQLLADADTLMYQSKKNGKGRVCYQLGEVPQEELATPDQQTTLAPQTTPEPQATPNAQDTLETPATHEAPEVSAVCG